MTEKVKEQILAIRDTGLTNMFDVPMVQRLAYERGYTTPRGKHERRDTAMTNAYELRTHFFLEDYNTAILREDFERFFTKTKEKVTFTFNGWDGKSYDGESRSARVYRTDLEGYENARFVKVGKHLHYIDEDSSVLEKATGEYHKEAEWLVDVLKAEN